MGGRQATAALLLAAAMLAGCQARRPDVPADIARATGIEHAVVFRSQAEPLTALSEGGTGSLTPEQALRLAMAHDPRIQAALAQVRVAEAEANQARLLPNPILSIDLRFPHGAGSNTAFEATVTGDLLSLLQKPGQIGAADKRLRASASDALTSALDVMSEVQQAYVAVQSSEAQVANARDRGKLLQQLRDIAQKRLTAGEGTRLDVLTLDAQILQAELDLSDLLITQTEDRLNLAKLLGQVRSPAQWQLSPWEAPPGGSGGGMEPEAAWIDAALLHRPEIRSKMWELRALGDDLQAAEFSPLAGGEMGVHTERDPEWRTGPTFTVPLPIFDWGQATREKILAQRIASRHELAGEQETVIQEVRLAYATYRYAGQALADATDKLLPVQRQQREMAQLAYTSGETELATLLLAETEVQLTLSKILDLQEKVTVARVKLQRAAGGAAVADTLQATATLPATPAATVPATLPAGSTTAPTSRPATGTAQ